MKLNQFKLKQKFLFEKKFLPLLNGNSINISDIPNILAVRDEFEPTYLDEFLWKFKEKNKLEYKKIFENIFDPKNMNTEKECIKFLEKIGFKIM